MKLEVSEVGFAYRRVLVLSGVNFTLESGRVLCVLGPNGAGKSTLLKCINRIIRPQVGCVMVDDLNVLSMRRKEIAKRIGYVAQSHSENEVSVFEAVLMGRKPHIRFCMNANDYRMVEDILNTVGIGHLGMRSFNELSGGEKQKVAIARALAQEPKILLLDEPTSHLDLKSGLEILKLVRRLVRGQALCAIIAVHDLNMALRFADQLLFLKNHQIHALTENSRVDSETIRQVYDINVVLQEVCGQIVVVPL